MFIGELAAVGTACLWGYSTYMHTNAAKLMGAWPLILFRFPLVLFYNIVLALLFGVSWEIPQASIPWLVASGIMGLGVADTLLYQGCVRIGAKMGAILWQVTPCVTALIAFFLLGETLSIQNMAGMLLIILSVIYVIMQEQHSGAQDVSPKEWRYGLILVTISIFALAISHVCIRKGLSFGIDPLMASILRICAALSATGLMVVLSGGQSAVFHKIIHAKGAIRIVLLASFFGTTIGNWMAVYSMQFAKAGIASTLMGLSPFAVIALSSLQERTLPSPKILLGVICAVCGSALLFV
ncbi:MAG: DMT family transporter [Desulfovibrionales bacterium]|nr:DMT family transporter [Desulfovibrionales bacterium]